MSSQTAGEKVRNLWKTGAGPEDGRTQYLVLQEERGTARPRGEISLDRVGYVLNKAMIYMGIIAQIQGHKILDTIRHDA